MCHLIIVLLKLLVLFLFPPADNSDLFKLPQVYRIMAHKQIYYSDKYDDDKYEYRSVILLVCLKSN